MDPALRVADVTVRSLREGKDNGGKKTKEETKTLKGYEEDGRTEEEAFSHRPKGGTFRPPVAKIGGMVGAAASAAYLNSVLWGVTPEYLLNIFSRKVYSSHQ